MDKVTWECPICGCNAYQRYGGTVHAARKITKDGENGEERSVPTSLRLGTHFMCRGCSVFFSNPKLFRADPIREKRRMEGAVDLEGK